MHIYWAVAITLTGSLLAVTLEKYERWLQAEQHAAHDRLESSAAAGTSWSDGVRLHKLEAWIGFSNLVQGTLGWVAGCAWTDVTLDVFPVLSARPSLRVICANIAAAFLLTAVSFAWLVLNAADGAAAKADTTDRAQVMQLPQLPPPTHPPRARARAVTMRSPGRTCAQVLCASHACAPARTAS